jgi:menaquinone-dependent protoporphyrinogen oxidase
MTRILVVYGTRSGCTTTIAQRIGQSLRSLPEGTPGPADGGPVEVDVADVETAPSPGAYDAVVVGSGVRAGAWHSSAADWVRAHAEVLRETPVAFFTVGLTVATDPGKAELVRAYTDPLVEETGVEPVDVGVFPGWYHPGRLRFHERIMLRAMHAPEGDFRDLPAVAAWVRSVAPLLASMSSARD